MKATAQKSHIVIDARIRQSSTGRYVDRLIEHLQRIDPFHRYTILTRPEDPWEPTAANFKRVHCPYDQFSLNPVQQFGFAKQLFNLKPDLVHFTMSQQPLLYFGNIVTTSHDTTMYRFVRRGSTPIPIYKTKMALYRFLVWQAHLKSKKVIVPTNTVAEEFAKRQRIVANKLVVTYEASEPPLPDKPEKPQGITNDFIMYVGTAFPHKNLPKLLDAFDIIHKKNPSLQLVFVGKHEKHYQELIEEAESHASFKQMVFTGFIPDAGLKWCYQHTKCYVFPSLSEGFGLPPLEAMAHGAPVASSNASCMPEVYGEAAYYFNPRDPKDIAGKVEDVLVNPELQKRLIENGKEQLKKYSWSRMAEETLIVYKEALGDLDSSNEKLENDPVLGSNF